MSNDDAAYVLADAVRGAAWEQKLRHRIGDLDAPDLMPRAKELINLGHNLLFDTKPIPPDKRLVVNCPIGLGTYQWKYGYDVVERAIELGVGVIDTAETYGFGKVEKELGNVLRVAEATKLNETIIATKVSRSHMSYAATYNAAKRSLDKLGLNFIDLYQIHWPSPTVPIKETLTAMARLLEEKVIMTVGVCNFSASHLLQAMETAREFGFEIVSNQIRINKNDPGNTDYLVKLCQKLGVLVIGYSPLGQGDKELTKDPVGSVQWALNHADCVIPATNKVEHLNQLFDHCSSD